MESQQFTCSPTLSRSLVSLLTLVVLVAPATPFSQHKENAWTTTTSQEIEFFVLIRRWSQAPRHPQVHKRREGRPTSHSQATSPWFQCLVFSRGRTSGSPLCTWASTSRVFIFLHLEPFFVIVNHFVVHNIVHILSIYCPWVASTPSLDSHLSAKNRRWCCIRCATVAKKIYFIPFFPNSFCSTLLDGRPQL